jgi:signal transduction histidine kinase/ActR/RegA family two-component response regulator
VIEGQAPDTELLSGWLSQTAEVERLSARVRALADAVPVGVVLMTRDRLLYANRRAARVVGRAPESLPATPLSAIFPDAQLRGRVQAALRRAWAGAAEDLGRITVTGEDGTTTHASVSLRPLPRELEPTLLVTLDDQAASGRIPSRPESDTLRVFGLYLAGLANDLRGPLTAYLGHLTLLAKRTDLPEDLREAFELYRQVTADTLARFGRAMEWGRRVPVVERVDLRDVLQAVAATFESEASADIHLTLEMDQVPAVAGNADQLQLAVEHVLRNAWEALTGRGGNIRARVGADHGRVTLTVADDGPGIPDSLLPHVFDPFSSTKSITAGGGLGLAIVKDIVNRHQGQVSMASSPAGTTVTLVFDAAARDGRAAARSARRRVLLVEDNLALMETYRMLLEKAGFEVVGAGDVDQALLVIGRETVDALLLDVQMPGRDGLALVEALGTWHPHLLPRVALHTAYAYEDRVQAVAQRYRIMLLEKPCPFEKLVAAVTRLATAPAA